MRQGAACLGGLLLGFVLAEAGLATNPVTAVALIIGVAMLAFAFVR